MASKKKAQPNTKQKDKAKKEEHVGEIIRELQIKNIQEELDRYKENCTSLLAKEIELTQQCTFLQRDRSDDIKRLRKKVHNREEEQIKLIEELENVEKKIKWQQLEFEEDLAQQRSEWKKNDDEARGQFLHEKTSLLNRINLLKMQRQGLYPIIDKAHRATERMRKTKDRELQLTVENINAKFAVEKPILDEGNRKRGQLITLQDYFDHRSFYLEYLKDRRDELHVTIIAWKNLFQKSLGKVQANELVIVNINKICQQLEKLVAEQMEIDKNLLKVLDNIEKHCDAELQKIYDDKFETEKQMVEKERKEKGKLQKIIQQAATVLSSVDMGAGVLITPALIDKLMPLFGKKWEKEPKSTDLPESCIKPCKFCCRHNMRLHNVNNCWFGTPNPAVCGTKPKAKSKKTPASRLSICTRHGAY